MWTYYKCGSTVAFLFSLLFWHAEMSALSLASVCVLLSAGAFVYFKCFRQKWQHLEDHKGVWAGIVHSFITAQALCIPFSMLVGIFAGANAFADIIMMVLVMPTILIIGVPILLAILLIVLTCGAATPIVCETCGAIIAL